MTEYRQDSCDRCGGPLPKKLNPVIQGADTESPPRALWESEKRLICERCTCESLMRCSF